MCADPAARARSREDHLARATSHTSTPDAPGVRVSPYIFERHASDNPGTVSTPSYSLLQRMLVVSLGRMNGVSEDTVFVKLRGTEPTGLLSGRRCGMRAAVAPPR